MEKVITVTGHRGAAGLAPENTIAAFQTALDLGCDAVELDVQLSKDGRLAVIHDETLDRTTDGSGRVADRTMSELESLDAGDGEKIPLLTEVFDLLKDSGMTIQIELKGPGTALPTSELIIARGMEKRVRLTSFYHRRVLAAKRAVPQIEAGIIITCNPADPGPLLESALADCLHVNHARIDEPLVTACRKIGKKIIAWGVVEDNKTIDRLIGLGVDAIGSNRPDMVIDNLKKKGLRN